MSEIPNFISDLALILIVAGVVTILFKKLKQPLVLGYVVAGFIVSPHMPYTMSVIDRSSIQTWADIGVMFLLFSLGLDFSFKKIMKMHHNILHDDSGHHRGPLVRLEPHGLHIPRRYAGNELNHDHI